MRDWAFSDWVLISSSVRVLSLVLIRLRRSDLDCWVVIVVRSRELVVVLYVKADESEGRRRRAHRCMDMDALASTLPHAVTRTSNGKVAVFTDLEVWSVLSGMVDYTVAQKVEVAILRS